MYKLILVLAFVTAVSGSMAQPESHGKAKIAFENPNHDFGEIDRGKTVQIQFKFKNTGTGPLTIKDIATSCGCTSAKPEKTEFAPGESGEIGVSFDSTRFTGVVTKKITISTNDPKNSRTTLIISGTVVSEILSKPDHIFFANARHGKASQQEILVSTTRLEKLEIKNLKATPDFLSATQEQLDDQSVRITIIADGSKFPEGQVRPRGTVQFETNAETQPKILANVTINIVSPIGVHPRYAMFWATPKGKRRQLNIRLVANDDTKFQIESLKSSLTFITVEKIGDSEDKTSFNITLKPDAPEGQFKGKITIQTTHPEQKNITIPLRGSVIAKP